MNFIEIFFNLLLTVVTCTLPIIIYRFAIIKEPVNPKRAKKISIIYGICAFIIFTIIYSIIGQPGVPSATVFWSWINYIILKKGYEESISETETDEVTEEQYPSGFDKIDLTKKKK